MHYKNYWENLYRNLQDTENWRKNKTIYLKNIFLFSRFCFIHGEERTTWPIGIIQFFEKENGMNEN